MNLIRVSFVGELGWEVHGAVSDMPEIFDAVWAAGQPHRLTPFGMFALDSLRLEKGYRAWKSDLSSDYSLFHGGLGASSMGAPAESFCGSERHRP